MENHLILSKIKEYNSRIDVRNINRILIVYDLNIFFIGDTCIQAARFKKLKSVYPNATIDVNTVNPKHYELVYNVIKDNPYIRYFNFPWSEIDFTCYDLVICACIPEQTFLEFISLNYGEKIISSKMNTAFFSVHGNVGFDEKPYGIPVFPNNAVFNNFRLTAEEYKTMAANEIFISDEEINKSTEWLKEKGLKENEHLFIFLDNASARGRLLNINNYFNVLKWFLEFNNIKILIFDENGVGKEEFYNAWLGNEKLSQKLIFAEKTSLRESICLIGSNRLKLIFGPSTGLMHCASGIVNVRTQNDPSDKSLPIMIGHVGCPEEKQQEDKWWGPSLVDMVLLVREENSKRLCYLRDIDFEQIFSADRILSCQEISNEMLIDFIVANYTERFNELGIEMNHLIKH